MSRSDMYLYHYTNDQGIEGIRQSGIIIRSSDTNYDAVLGEGVYFTHLPPNSSDYELLQNNFGGMNRSNQDKVTWYVQINIQSLPGIMRKRIGNRIIYVYPSDIVLPLRHIPNHIKRRQ